MRKRVQQQHRGTWIGLINLEPFSAVVRIPSLRNVGSGNNLREIRVLKGVQFSAHTRGGVGTGAGAGPGTGAGTGAGVRPGVGAGAGEGAGARTGERTGPGAGARATTGTTARTRAGDAAPGAGGGASRDAGPDRGCWGTRPTGCELNLRFSPGEPMKARPCKSNWNDWTLSKSNNHLNTYRCCGVF